VNNCKRAFFPRESTQLIDSTIIILSKRIRKKTKKKLERSKKTKKKLERSKKTKKKFI